MQGNADTTSTGYRFARKRHMWNRLRTGACVLLAVAFGLALAGSVEAQVRACKDIAADAERASREADTAALIDLYGESDSARPACPDIYRLCLGRSVAHSFVDRAYDAYQRNAPIAELEQYIAEARRWGHTWKVSLAEAELAEQRKDFDKAALHYQEALNDLSQASPCAGEEAGVPDTEGLQAIFERASVTGLLASDFIEPPRDRNNDPGGIFLPSVRGMTPKERAIPVQFEFDSVAFTAKGTEAANALIDYINRNKQKFAVVRLSGHTDLRGGEGYNCDLSARRLKALADYLHAGGLVAKPRFELIPQGEFRPVTLDDPSWYSRKEIDQANRRVVLIEGHAEVARACP